jgi:hypothetical protein
MTMVAVLEEPGNPGSMTYRAIAGRTQAMGRTAGEALDALTAQLSPEAIQTLVIVRDMKPDEYFDADQRRRLAELMSLRRAALAGAASWSPADAAELEHLVGAELLAATRRAEALARDLGK